LKDAFRLPDDLAHDVAGLMSFTSAHESAQ